MDKVEESLINNLKKFNLIDKKLIVGVSGGGDSTSLLIALSEIKKMIPQIYFEAFHVNYGLRKESNDDEVFVKKICKKLKVKIVTKNIKEEKINLRGDSENELRNTRYQLISSYVLKSKSYCLLTGHNLNDHIETFLMKISRGAGLKGIEGINYFSTLEEFKNLKIFRPLLSFKKEDLNRYCTSKNIKPMNDITNFNIKFTRNRIRKNIIPEFEKLNPDFLSTVNRLTNLIKELNIYQNRTINEIFKKIKIKEDHKKISFNRKKFNLLENFEKKLILKSKCESLSHSIFIESKHIDIILEKCFSEKNNFSLDMPGPIIINATKDEISLEKLVTK
jgi:tRNA(Ile)-lysidine synthase